MPSLVNVHPVDLLARTKRIRRAPREQGLSEREFAVRFRVSRNTVRKALESPVLPKRKSPPRKSVLKPVKSFIDAMLRADLDAPAKQKHTIPRTMEGLAAEHDFSVSAFYRAPGERGAREKGGVEHEGGRFLPQAPGPAAGGFAGGDERAAGRDRRRGGRPAHPRPAHLDGFDFQAERDRLRPLPADDHDCGLDLVPTVARNFWITVRQCYYSVPSEFIGTKVRVKLRANELWVFDAKSSCHPRLTRRYTHHDILEPLSGDLAGQARRVSRSMRRSGRPPSRKPGIGRAPGC
jgi:transcriptional regulator with XRE-family HTH domain